MPVPEREGMLRRIAEDLNPFHIVLIIYAVPIVLGFLVIAAGFVMLALADSGFAHLLLLTMIVGMIVALPTALRP